MLNEEEIKQNHEQLVFRNFKFNKVLNNLIVPYRFPILAILSTYKTTIFSDEIIDLMEFLAKEDYKDYHKDIE